MTIEVAPNNTTHIINGNLKENEIQNAIRVNVVIHDYDSALCGDFMLIYDRVEM